MKQILGAVLAGLIAFNGGLQALPWDPELKASLAFFAGIAIAALGFYLGPVIGAAIAKFSEKP